MLTSKLGTSAKTAYAANPEGFIKTNLAPLAQATTKLISALNPPPPAETGLIIAPNTASSLQSQWPKPTTTVANFAALDGAVQRELFDIARSSLGISSIDPSDTATINRVLAAAATLANQLGFTETTEVAAYAVDTSGQPVSGSFAFNAPTGTSSLTPGKKTATPLTFTAAQEAANWGAVWNELRVTAGLDDMPTEPSGDLFDAWMQNTENAQAAEQAYNELNNREAPVEV